jgi:hypothetical protein
MAPSHSCRESASAKKSYYKTCAHSRIQVKNAARPCRAQMTPQIPRWQSAANVSASAAGLCWRGTEIAAGRLGALALPAKS